MAVRKARHPPADHGCLQCAAGFVIPPPAVEITAGERQLVGSALVLAQHLDRQARWRFARAIEFSQPSFACCHLIFPALRGADAPFQFPARFVTRPFGIKSAE